MKDPNDTRNVAPRRGSPLWIDMIVVTAIGAVVVALAVLDLYHQQIFKIVPGQEWPAALQPLFWTVPLMIVMGEAWGIATPGRYRAQSPSAAAALGFAVLLYWGPAVAIVMRVAAIILVSLAQRKSVHRLAFNAAQISISLGAAGLALAAAGHTPSVIHAWEPRGNDLGAVLASGATYAIVNFTLVIVALSLYSRSPVVSVARANLRPQGLSQLVLMASGPLIVVLLAGGSARIFALLTFPIAAIYLSGASALHREHQANHDELTGLCNRKLLTSHSNEALTMAAATGTRAGFLLLDLDRSSGLKEVNDTLGHAVGDQLLQIVAQRLSRSVRPGDVVSRLGGDEFAVLLPSVRDVGSAREVAARLRAALSEPVRLEAMTFDIRASVGIAIYPDDAADLDELMLRADVAMYLAKERRSGIERYEAAADRNSADRLALVGDLRRALHRSEIELAYQPKVLLSSGWVIGVEALARWPHPQRGLLTAAEFVSLAEQSYLMSELTDLVIGKALDQAAKWWLDGLRIEVCVNVPARDLLSARLPEMINHALRRHGLPAAALRLDIDEQVLARKSEQAAATVRALADLGVGISLDNFGTGHSSLAVLTRLGVSEVKLDQSLIADLPGCREKTGMVKSLVNLAKSMSICSVGEGVEAEPVADALRVIGCDAAQGWLFSRPLTADQATCWLTEHISGELAPAINGPASARELVAGGVQRGPQGLVETVGDARAAGPGSELARATPAV